MFKRTISIVLVMTMTWAGYAKPASAAAIDTQQAASLELRQAQIDLVQAQLARTDIRQGLIRLGVDPDQAASRVADLNDQDLMKLHNQLDSVPAGSGVLGLIGAVFVVLLILELTGVIDIFKKT